jgi:hypothetical protein
MNPRYQNLNLIVGKSISIHGFIFFRLQPKWVYSPWIIAPLLTATLTRYQEEFYKTMPADIASGKIK